MHRSEVSVASFTPTGTGYTAEQVIATIPPVPLGDNPLISGVVVDVVMQSVTSGAGTTTIVFKVKRGSGTGGTQVGPTVTFTGTAPAPVAPNTPIQVLDAAPVSGLGYVITAQATAGPATGMMSVGYLAASATAA